MLDGGFKPQIISMEINEKIPPGVFFTVDYDDNHYWLEDHFFGCSIDAAAYVVKPNGYILASIEYNNAFFIRNDVASDAFIDLTPEKAYIDGYKNRHDRATLFPWNADVENWLHCESSEAVDMIRQKFRQYSGRFTLHTTTSDFMTVLNNASDS